MDGLRQWDVRIGALVSYLLSPIDLAYPNSPSDDLSCHTKATGVPLVVRESRKEPLVVTEFVAETDKAKFGPRFKKDGKAVQAVIDQLTQDVKEKLSLELKENGKITIDVPDIGNGRVELTSGTRSTP
jgi:glycyl-tRNA synthetase